jgi:hypothetical protein
VDAVGTADTAGTAAAAAPWIGSGGGAGAFGIFCMMVVNLSSTKVCHASLVAQLSNPAASVFFASSSALVSFLTRRTSARRLQCGKA